MSVTRISTLFLSAAIVAATGCGGGGATTQTGSVALGNSGSGSTGGTTGNLSGGSTGATSSGATSAGGASTGGTTGGVGSLSAGGSGIHPGTTGGASAGGSTAGSTGGTTAGSSGGTTAGSGGATTAGSSAGGTGANPGVPAGGYKIVAFDLDMALAGFDGYGVFYTASGGSDETWVLLNADYNSITGIQVLVNGTATTPMGALSIGAPSGQGPAKASLLELDAISQDGTTVQVVVAGGAPGGSGSSNTVTMNPTQFKNNLSGAFHTDSPQDAGDSLKYENNAVTYTWEPATGAVSFVVLDLFCDADVGGFEVREAVQVPAAIRSYTAGTTPSGATVFFDGNPLTPCDPSESWASAMVDPNSTSDGGQFFGFSVLALDSTGWAFASTQVDPNAYDWPWFDVQ